MSKPAILVVDDDESIGDMLKLMLEHKGYTVVVSRDTEKLEEKILTGQVSLVILDMLIGHVKGTDICVMLKGNPATSMLPVLMMTALPGIEEICAAAGADDFIAKPFEMDVFLSKVHKLTSGS